MHFYCRIICNIFQYICLLYFFTVKSLKRKKKKLYICFVNLIHDNLKGISILKWFSMPFYYILMKGFYNASVILSKNLHIFPVHLISLPTLACVWHYLISRNKWYGKYFQCIIKKKKKSTTGSEWNKEKIIRSCWKKIVPRTGILYFFKLKYVLRYLNNMI